MNERVAHNENFNPMEQSILKGESGKFLYDENGERKDHARIRAELKEILISYGVSDEEAEIRLKKSLDRYKDTDSDENLSRVMKKMVQVAWEDYMENKNNTEQSTEKETGNENTPKTLENTDLVTEGLAHNKPKSIEDVDSFKEHLTASPESFMNKVDERIRAFEQLFHIAGIKKEEEIESKFKEFQLEAKHIWAMKEAESLKDFFAIAKSASLDPLVINSRYAQWKKFINATERLYKSLEEKLNTDSAQDAETVEEEAQEANPADKKVSKEKDPSVEQKEDLQKLGYSEDRIKKAKIRWGSEVANQTEDIKKEEEKEEKGEREGTEETKSAYEKARDEWMEARHMSDAAESEYRTALSEYYKKLEGQSWFSGGKMKHEYRKLFGLRPELTPELQALQEKTIEARTTYKKRGAELADAKYNKDAERKITVNKRYERILAQKIIVRNFAERNNVQQEVLKEKYPDGTPARKFMDKMNKYKYVRMGGAIGAYTLIGLATGGVGAAGIAGGSRAAGMISGLIAGGTSGAVTQNLLEKFYVAKREKEHEAVTESTRASLFNNSITELEKEFEESAGSVDRAKRNTKIASASAAAIAGLGAGAAAGGYTSSQFNGGESVPVGSDPDTKDSQSETRVPLVETNAVTASASLSSNFSGAESPVPDHEKTEKVHSDNTPTETEDAPSTALPKSDFLGVSESEAEHKDPYNDIPQAPSSETLEEAPQPAAHSEEHSEAVPEPDSESHTSEIHPEAGDLYTVVQGDNLWNIVEERYQETLKQLPSESARNIFIDTILDKLAASDELRHAVGLERPNIDLIKPGEQFNLAPLDSIAAKVGSTYGVTPEIHAPEDAPENAPLKDPVLESSPESQPENNLESEPVRSIGEMRLGEILVLAEQVKKENENAIARLEALGIERTYLEQTAAWLHMQSGESIDTTLTLDQFSSMHEREIEPENRNYTGPESTKAEEIPQSEADDRHTTEPESTKDLKSDILAPDTASSDLSSKTDYEGTVPLSELEDHNEPSPDTIKEDAETPPAQEVSTEPQTQEVNAELRDKTIKAVEGSKGLLDGIFGSSGSAGTFEKIENFTMSEIREVLLMDERTRDSWLAKNNISEEGWTHWINWISQKAEPVVPVDQKLTFGQYLNTVVNAQSAASTANV